MKSVVLALFLFAFPLLSNAQAPSERPSSRFYGWFRDVDWARDRMLSAPGWELQANDKDVEGWHRLGFAKMDESQGIIYRLREGGVARITYTFVKTTAEAGAWRTAGLEKVGENEWVDRPNNGRVKRYYNGNTVDYRVTYEAFTKD